MTPVAAGRAWAAVAHPVEVVDGLFEPHVIAVLAGAFGKSRLVRVNVVNCPMVPFARRCIRVVAEKDETAGSRRCGLPVQGRGEVISIAGEARRDPRSVRKGTLAKL